MHIYINIIPSLFRIAYVCSIFLFTFVIFYPNLANNLLTLFTISSKPDSY